MNHAAGLATTAAAGYAYAAEISADGRWIVFRSTAADLVPGQIDTNGIADVFLAHDRRIHRRCEDSVVRAAFPIRRSRGFVPVVWSVLRIPFYPCRPNADSRS